MKNKILEIKKIDEKNFDEYIRREHYLHRANSTQPAIHYAIYFKEQLVSLFEWSAIFKPILLRFPFLQHLEIVDNSRFLIRHGGDLFGEFPEIYNLGTQSLSLAIKKIKVDWIKLTKIKPKLLITYIDQERGLKGTVYKAGNWIEIENSAGKNYSKKKKIDYKPSKKKTFIYPLVKGFEWRPVTFFDKNYLIINYKKLNSVAQYNYKPKTNVITI